MKNYLYLILLLLPCLCYAQDAFEGQVINKTTEAPISGVTVRLLKGKIATQTNQRGYYSLSKDSAQPNDTLQYSYVGYKTLKLPVAAYEPQMFIMLEPMVTQLAEVRITNNKTKAITLSKFSAYDIKTVVSNSGTKYTAFITSPTNITKHFEAPGPNGLLLSVSLGRQEHPMSPSYATKNDLTRFLLKVYTTNPFTGAPSELLFTKEISLTDNAKRIDIDLSKDNVIIPGNNFFVGVDWIISPYNEIISMVPAVKVDRTTRKGRQVYKDASDYVVQYQPFLIGYYREDNMPESDLYSLRNNKWVKTSYNNSELALSATLQY